MISGVINQFKFYLFLGMFMDFHNSRKNLSVFFVRCYFNYMQSMIMERNFNEAGIRRKISIFNRKACLFHAVLLLTRKYCRIVDHR